jgi:hypothetical protein
MTIASDCIDVSRARAILEGRGLSREEEGFNNDFFEVWRNRTTGAVYSVAFCRFGDRSRYSLEAFDKVLDELDAP